MVALILLLLFGSVFAILALQNTTLVTVSLAQISIPDVPLFSVMIGSLLGGVLLAYVIYLVHTISTSLTIRGQSKKIKDAEGELIQLTKRVHQLELENTRLKKENHQENVDEKSL